MLTNDCCHRSLSNESTVLTDHIIVFGFTADAARGQVVFSPGIHNKRLLGPWFEVIAGGTGDRPPPHSKTAATFNFKHRMARTKNKRIKRLKGC